MKSIAILTGGGPAPGMNTVVASVAKTFLRDGYRVIGLHGGYSALFTENPRMQDLDFLTADEIFNKGGSILKMSRFKPTDEDFEKRFNLGVRGLWSHLNLSLDGTYYHYVSKGSEFSHTRNNFTANANAQFYWNNFVAGANFTLLPQWTLNAERYIMSEMAQSLYVQYRYKSLTAMLAWHCPFNKDGYRYETIGLSAVHPYHHTHWTANNGNMLVLGLTWQMDFGRKFHKGEKTLQNGGYDNGMVK